HGEARGKRLLCRITSGDLPDEAKFSAIGAEARRRDEHISDGTWPARSQLGGRLGILGRILGFEQISQSPRVGDATPSRFAMKAPIPPLSLISHAVCVTNSGFERHDAPLCQRPSRLSLRASPSRSLGMFPRGRPSSPHRVSRPDSRIKTPATAATSSLRLVKSWSNSDDEASRKTAKAKRPETRT